MYISMTFEIFVSAGCFGVRGTEQVQIIYGTYKRICIRTNKYIYIYTYTHIHIHTHIHINVYIYVYIYP